jgi:hypothetical protein
MAAQLFNALDIWHSTMSSYPHQCNSQAEVCNKTIAKYLAAFVNVSTLDWEPYVPALMFAYNTSFHRFVQATPFSLTYGLKARLPAFFAPDFRRMQTHTFHLLFSPNQFVCLESKRMEHLGVAFCKNSFQNLFG